MAAGSSEMDWQVGIRQIGKRGRQLLINGKWSDCTFKIGNEDKMEMINAHRLILAMASPVFEAMFYGKMADKEDKPIEILDVQPQAFKVLLQYIYSDEINLRSFDQVCEVCYAAKKYMIPPIVEECTKYIWKDLNPGNVCHAYEFARLFEEPKLMEECIARIRSRTEDIVKDASFEDLDVATLRTILTQDTLNVTELVLWEGCVRWAKRECVKQGLENTPENQRLVLKEILPLIRFLTLTPNQFTNGPVLSNILTKEECLCLLMNISSPGVCSVLENFSSSITPRAPLHPLRALGWSSCGPSQDASVGLDETKVCHCVSGMTDTLINDQLVDCTLSFSVDSPVCITGVILPTQLMPSCHQQQSLLDCGESALMDMTRPATSPQLYSDIVDRLRQPNLIIHRYSELIYAFMQDSDGCRITYTHITSKVQWEDSIEVLFNRPVRIRPNLMYKIVIVMNRVGRYPLYSIRPIVSINSVTFSFPEQRDNIVKALLFQDQK